MNLTHDLISCFKVALSRFESWFNSYELSKNDATQRLRGRPGIDRRIKS
jgi:hypothetical protein